MTKSKREGGFDFRDLKSFNSARLAKMAAMMIEESDALWVRLLKGLYFSATNFLHAGKGSKTSWGCSSLLAGQDILQNEGMWLLGDGRTITIRAFTEPWIPSRRGQRIGTHPITETQTATRVVD